MTLCVHGVRLLGWALKCVYASILICGVAKRHALHMHVGICGYACEIAKGGGYQVLIGV